MANDKYVDGNYSNGYVEGDSPLVRDLNNKVDLIISQLALIREEQMAHRSFFNTLDVDVEAINNIVTLSSVKIDDVSTNISDVATKTFINNKVPFVDDQNIRILRKGTRVKVVGFDGICEIVGSHFVPQDELNYVVVYTVSFSFDGELSYSDFVSNDVTLYISD